MAVLTEDNTKPLEDVLACAFPNYDLTTQTENASEAQHDSSISSAEDSDDSDDEDDLEEYDFSGIDWCINHFFSLNFVSSEYWSRVISHILKDMRPYTYVHIFFYKIKIQCRGNFNKKYLFGLKAIAVLLSISTT